MFRVVAAGDPAGVTVPGDWPLIPSDELGDKLGAGDQFRLLFFTSGGRDAASTSISDYNLFVQAHASNGHEAIRPYKDEFRALASTDTVDANDNTAITYTMTDTGVPIYALLVDSTTGGFIGAKLADDYENFCDGGWDAGANGDETGARATSISLWTGTDNDCEAYTDQGLGRLQIRTALSGVTTNPLSAGSFSNQNEKRSLYGLSPVFTVSSAPSPPDAPVVSEITDVSARASWTEPSFSGAFDIDEYGVRVRRCLSDLDAPCTSWTGWGYVFNAGASARSHVITTYGDDKGTVDAADDEDLNLAPETRYQVRVDARSTDDKGTTDTDDDQTLYSGWSEPTEFVTAPAMPTDLSAAARDTEVRLSWQSAATDPAQLTHYTVQYDDDADFSSPQSVDTAASDPEASTLAPTELTVTGLANGTAYHFRVRAARGTEAASRWTDAVAATPAPLTDYDSDDDGLIEISNLAQLDVVRWDLDGNGEVTDDANTADFDEADAYLLAFPNPVDGMGCALADHDGDPNTDPQPVCTGYELTADLDFDEDGDGSITSADAAYWNGGAGWEPIGDGSTPFTATFDGNGNTISTLFINRTASAGLFGTIGAAGAVRDLGLVGVNVTGSGDVGGLAAESAGTITASYVTGSVSGGSNAYVGGLVGENVAAVSASYSSAQVTGAGSLIVGGLVGRNANTGAISASYSTGSVSGTGTSAGGLVGESAGAITASYSTGSVSATGTYVGGLVGRGSGSPTVTASYWNTESSGQATSAGGTGKTGAELREPTGYTGIYANWNLDLDNADDDDSHSTGQDNSWDFGADYNYPTLRDAPGKQKGPGPVTDLTAAPNDAGALVASWSAPTDVGDGTLTGNYAGRYSSDGGATWTAFDAMSGTTFTIASPTAASYRIEVWTTGEGAAHTRSATASIGLPGVPRNLSLAGSSGQIDVSWAAPDDNGGSEITGYLLDWRATGATNWTPLTLSATDTSRSFTGLTDGGTYEFRLAATNADGTGPWAGPLTEIASNPIDYDTDGDGLIEVDSLAKLNAMGHDLNADGVADTVLRRNAMGDLETDETLTAAAQVAYEAAFPNPADRMGCPATGCNGYELTADLDFDEDGNGQITSIGDPTYWNGGAGWRPIGDYAFPDGMENPLRSYGAKFDGNGHTISNLFINRPSANYIGLFGYTTGGISNIGLEGVNVTGNEYVGGLVGSNFGPVEFSYSSGAVSATTRDVGGLTGHNQSNITASYTSGTVSGGSNAGGLTGHHNGFNITASYSTAAVTGTSSVGGLIGQSEFTTVVTASYATGSVSGTGDNIGGLIGLSHNTAVFTNSYWDTGTSGKAVGVGSDDADDSGAIDGTETATAGVTGKTSAELRTPTGYTGIYANWNLNLDGVTGNDDPWDFGMDYNYPTLRDAPGNQKGPGPVTDLTAAHDDLGRVKATWTAPTDIGDGTLTPGYSARYSTDGGTNWRFAAISPADGEAYTFIGLSVDTYMGESYRLEVWVVSEGAAHTRSVTASIGVPGTLQMSLTSSTGRIDASWSAPADTGGSDITGYLLDWRAAGATSWTSLTLPAATTSRSFTGLTDGGAYEFRMAATNADGAGPFTETLRAVASDTADYDSDNDGLIDISNLAQLNAVRYDLDGDGAVDTVYLSGGVNVDTAATTANETAYAAAFPQAPTGMGCPTSGCVGYELMADLTFSAWNASNPYWNGGEGWEPITGGEGGDDPQFTAVFEGNGNTIANLFIERSGDDRQGLFGILGRINDGGATVRNLILTGADVTGDDRIGILAGRSYGTAAANTVISNISVSGSVTASDDRAGGLVGDLGTNSAIAASYSSAAVSGDDQIGGLVGDSDSGTRITASYATGSVTGNDDVGGLVGANYGAVTASFSTGAVSGSTTDTGGLLGWNWSGATVTASYWDTESSGQTTSAGGTGKTGAELRTPTSYTGIYANWNLDLDGDSTLDNPWDFGAAHNYPTLRDTPGNQKGPGRVGTMTATRPQNAIVVRWDAPSDHGEGAVTGYQFRFSRDGGTTWTLDWANAPDDTPNDGATITVTPQNTPHRIVVEARAVTDAAHRRGPAERIEPPQNAPQITEILTYTGRLDIFWDAPQDDGGPDITGYWVEYKEDGTNDVMTANVAIDGRTASITGLSNGTTYNVRVAAMSAMGLGAYSDRRGWRAHDDDSALPARRPA